MCEEGDELGVMGCWGVGVMVVMDVGMNFGEDVCCGNEWMGVEGDFGEGNDGNVDVYEDGESFGIVV